MSKLESEYDYDTDQDQINRSKAFLIKDLYEAVSWTVKENPVDLIGNVEKI
jgi:hypothetical protein